MLIQWLCSYFDTSHWLSKKISWNDVALMSVQFCTHLMTAGVLKKIEKHTHMDNKFQVFLYI